ncbi:MULTISPECIES: gluconate 2-dehydrogenase subunit 3 family protein [Chitinophagaceae]
MNRRELIKHISIITGAAFVGGDFFLSGCKNTAGNAFDKNDIAFLDEIAETIIPKTNTPGAKDAEVGKFIALYATECYSDAELDILRKGIKQLNDASLQKYNEGFMKINPQQKEALLTAIDTEAEKAGEQSKEKKDVIHYFTLMKQLTLLGFFTSKQGATQVLRYMPVPGTYKGCVEYKGEAAWS